MAFENLAKIYAKFVKKEEKKFADVPNSIKEQVKAELIKMKAPAELYS